MKTSTKAILAFSAIVVTASVLAETAQARKFNASRARVEAACGSSGAAYGTRSNGAYGCVNDNGWVHCTARGSCEGGRASRQTSRNSSRAMPPSRNR
ncbi:MAG: hypothetical protein ACR2O0_15070 [Rhizobiaceae bacterium]